MNRACNRTKVLWWGGTALCILQKRLEKGRFAAPWKRTDVALNKFGDHLPLERQARRMKRVGLDVHSQTLWDQTFALANRLQPAIERLHDYLLSKEVVLADETRWPLRGALTDDAKAVRLQVRDDQSRPIVNAVGERRLR
ncbi:MAG: transposase [Myxococcota bacterium]